MKVDLSIIIPFYNAADYLHFPINSLKSQSYTTFEVILVNDGSTDNSGEIAEELIGNDTRFRIIYQENKGPGAARNTGIEQACGDYIGFIDGDDYFHDHFLKLMLDKIKEENSDIVICEIMKVSSDDKVLQRYPSAYSQPISGYEAFEDIMHCRNISSNVQNKLFKRSLFDSVRFPQGIIVNEDVATVYKLILGAKKISFIQQGLFFYVQRQGSSLNSFNPSRLNDRLEVASIVKEDLKERKLYTHGLFAAYYLQVVVLSGAQQAALYSGGSESINSFVDKLDKEIFNTFNIFKIAKINFKKMLALLLVKYCKPMFIYLAKREKQKNFQ